MKDTLMEAGMKMQYHGILSNLLSEKRLRPGHKAEMDKLIPLGFPKSFDRVPYGNISVDVNFKIMKDITSRLQTPFYFNMIKNVNAELLDHRKPDS